MCYDVSISPSGDYIYKAIHFELLGKRRLEKCYYYADIL